MKTIRWEYKTVEVKNNLFPEQLTENLDKMGQLGWELVGIYRICNVLYDGEVVVFKRPCDIR